MLHTLTTPLFFCLQLSFVLGLQIGGVLPRLVKDLSSSIFSHSAYVDQKVHHTTRSILNHEQWHQRHVVAFSNTSSLAYLTLSAPTSYSSTPSLGPLLSKTSASANTSSTASLGSALATGSVSTSSSNATSLAPPLPSASASALKADSLASLLGHTEDLEADNSVDWGDETESACSAALIALHGIATNPSGIAACYNIQSMNDSTGIFEVDLRLYRISAPKEVWVKLDTSSVGVGLSYVNATISAVKAKKAKREGRTLPWFPAQRDEAADIYIRRSTGAPPRRLESMNFMGTVDNGSLAELGDTTTALPLLTPAISLSGTQQDGTPINTQLSTQDASFVNGVFADVRSEASQSAMATEVNDSILPGTKLVDFPIGLVISSIWAVLYMMTVGYGTMSRYQARESYRRRVKKKFSGDAITKRTMRWA